MTKIRVALAALVCMLLVLVSASALAESPVEPVYPRSIKMTKAKATVVNAAGKGNTIKLIAKTAPAIEQLSEKITWSSDDESIARVDQEGVVTPVGEGKVSIRASIQGKTRVLSVACRVTVKAVRVNRFSIEGSDILLLDPSKASEKTANLNAVIEPATATFQGVTWESSDSSVVTVDQDGKATAKSVGSATITATTDNGRKKASVSVRVRNASKMVSITISAGGDVVLGGDPVKKTDKRFEQLISQSGSPDYGYVLKNLKRVFEKDDVTILNLEGPLKGGRARKSDRQFNFYGKPEYANILVEGSVEVANIANNHIDDYGTKGKTKEILRDAGIVRSDLSFSSENNSIVTKNGVRIGFVGFQTPYSSARMKAQILKARSVCDVVVVSLHFCDVPEHTHPIRSSQVKVAHRVVDWGADLVIGHHPHVTSGIEVYQGKYIFYGVGSVQSSGKNFRYNNFIMQQEILVEKGTGYTEPQVPTIYPISSSSAPLGADNNCQPMILSKSDDRYAYVVDLIDRYSKRSNVKAAPYKLGT